MFETILPKSHEILMFVCLQRDVKTMLWHDRCRWPAQMQSSSVTSQHCFGVFLETNKHQNLMRLRRPVLHLVTYGNPLWITKIGLKNISMGDSVLNGCEHCPLPYSFLQWIYMHWWLQWLLELLSPDLCFARALLSRAQGLHRAMVIQIAGIIDGQSCSSNS